MGQPERRFAVSLHEKRVGTLHAKGDTTWFVFDRSYVEDPQREILGLRLEQDRRARHTAHLRLVPWFSNLLPEGQLRAWIAAQRRVSIDRELELLLEVGGDLPGAVVVAPSEDVPTTAPRGEVVAQRPEVMAPPYHFSLAGVQLKFSVLKTGERFTCPASGEGGDWIIKLPDARFPFVPSNELAMMDLARRAGIDVPETRLVQRELISSLPDSAWPTGESEAYAVRRFDRAGGRRVHMEDLAQVRSFYAERKYDGSYETIANLIYRGRDTASLTEFVRRITFSVLIRNADAHLKNWSLLYDDPRIPRLSPAYDLVSTEVYPAVDRRLAHKLDGSRRFERVTLASIARLQDKIGGAGALPSFVDIADEVIERTLTAWPSVEATLGATSLAEPLREVLLASAASIRRAR